ncbi:hypothetical protein [[Clostridium] innocuum]|uniref:Uncharacterized protein n=1 Tax=[Clostridium] innocuum 2959 TaxID=999413 RepID=N9V582_CLOIN|nr:hypothetical protein [[Clostridium] innocuum]MDB3325222.1 hypothetical protein [Clostridioides difficile]ENY85780.1 hypothetical protein HMPREF1094_03473 [[Clostridium] innocuum 2959]MCR0163309.1 hypothetical protein [[Clostridium] innocuum]MCR0393331.1 hypothetical protein [[Clostridium] innocuum]MCR0487404.1 hypothetical protein [[Clostridium] innocuum]
MEKKTIVSAALLILAAATILWMNQPSETREKSQQSSTTIQKKPTTEPSPQSAVPNDVEEACKRAAERFVRVKSEGRSSDVLLDRIEPVKELLSDELYQSLVPDLSKEELAAMRRESKRIKKEETAETQVTSMDSAIDRIADDDFEVYIIYTAQMQHADRNDTSRYLVRMRVQWIDGKARIYKMVEESSLGNGFYEK